MTERLFGRGRASVRSHASHFGYAMSVIAKPQGADNCPAAMQVSAKHGL